MSRIGEQTIDVPENTKIELKENNLLIVEGPKGRLERRFNLKIKIIAKDKKISVERCDDSKEAKSLHGLSRTLVFNMVKGVTDGFSKTLEIRGVGYRASKSGDKLILNLGRACPVEIKDSKDIKTLVEQDKITVIGIDKEKVGQFAANIRKEKPPEPYKGKGIRYLGEEVKRKEGKTGSKK